MNCDSCAIKNLIYLYAQHIDNGDFDSVATMFDGGRIIAVDALGREVSIEGSAAVLALYQSFTRIYPDNNTPHTLHLTSNVVVEVEDTGTRACATSIALVFQAVEDFPLQPVIGVRYSDIFTRESAGWRFEQRRIETRLSGDLSRHLLRQPG